jgi:hypothetical protein
MDTRKKQINDLEQRKREQTIFLDGLLIRLGETILGRDPDSSLKDNSAFEEIGVYLWLLPEANQIVISEYQYHRIKSAVCQHRNFSINLN